MLTISKGKLLSMIDAHVSESDTGTNKHPSSVNGTKHYISSRSPPDTIYENGHSVNTGLYLYSVFFYKIKCETTRIILVNVELIGAVKVELFSSSWFRRKLGDVKTHKDLWIQ